MLGPPWAELLLIAGSQDPATLVGAWHALPGDLYDFSLNMQRVEVKSAVGHVRRHHFSMEQLNPPADTMVIVASVLVARAGGGTSVADLVDQICSRLASNPDLLLQIDYIVGLTLCENWRSVMDDRFDRELATSSLAFFEASTIPAIRTPVPSELSNVNFVSDLSNTARIDVKIYRKSGELFAALVR